MSDRGYYTPKNEETPLSQFKTPLPYQTPKSMDSDRDCYFTPGKGPSDSEESTHSNSDDAASAGTGSSRDRGELTIVAEFDDLMRCVRQQRCDEVEDSYLEFAEQVKEMRAQWQLAVQECRRLQGLLDKKTHDFSDLESKLAHARQLLDQEKRHTKRAEEERDVLVIDIPI